MYVIWLIMSDFVPVLGTNVTKFSNNEHTKSVTFAYDFLHEVINNPTKYSLTSHVAVFTDGVRSKLRETMSATPCAQSTRET